MALYSGIVSLPHSTLVADRPKADFPCSEDAATGFTIRLTVVPMPFTCDRTILDIPDVLTVRLRQHEPGDRDRQNYPAFKMLDGSVPVLEATLSLHSDEHPDWREMTIGIPLAMLEVPAVAATAEAATRQGYDIELVFSGVRWSMVVDGVELDNDFPFGYPRWVETHTWWLDSNHVDEASLYFSAITPDFRSSVCEISDIQYWTPPGHNCWVGDVATFYHRGHYHVFYLYDRRHHKSKFGTGGHYFEHLSTADFKTWTHHEAATPIETQCETIGTGTPFVSDGNLCLAYGLHTERIYPDDDTTLPAQLTCLEEQGHTGLLDRGAPGAPIGSTYAVSEDGVTNFRKTWCFFHPCRNPSVYRDPDGKLRMFANNGSKGTWQADRVNDSWRCVDSVFPPGGDCTFYFRWGEYDYVIGGFTDLWAKSADADGSVYRNLAEEGLDFYDGLNVPAVTQIADGRFLMAGWTHIRGWGGNLVIRELIQFPDGKIGSKWLAEVTPETGTAKVLASQIVDSACFEIDAEPFELTFRVQPYNEEEGALAVVFLPEDGEQNACELQIRLDDQRAQFGPGSLTHWAAKQKSLREGGKPHRNSNYSIEHLRGVDRPFTVRVIVRGEGKLGGSLIDVEIAGQRTMISYRPDLAAVKIQFKTTCVEIQSPEFATIQ